MPILSEWNLSEKNILITADRRGWTPYLADYLSEAGANLIIVGNSDSDMKEAAAHVKNVRKAPLTIETNLLDESSILETIETAYDSVGQIHCLVNNAKADFGKRFESVTATEWDTLYKFNFKSMVLFSQIVGTKMLEHGYGRIVNMTSNLAKRGLWNSVAACSVEGAIHQFTSSLALEWGREGIRVNGIGAGWISKAPQSEQDPNELLLRYLPSRRKGHPTDLAGLLVYLASESCDFVNGQTRFIDGGSLAHA